MFEHCPSEKFHLAKMSLILNRFLFKYASFISLSFGPVYFKARIRVHIDFWDAFHLLGAS
jgi:hypothetical protein